MFVLFVEISTIAGEVQIGGSFAVFTGNVLERSRPWLLCFNYHIILNGGESFLFGCTVEKRKSGPMMTIILERMVRQVFEKVAGLSIQLKAPERACQYVEHGESALLNLTIGIFDFMANIWETV